MSTYTLPKPILIQDRQPRGRSVRASAPEPLGFSGFERRLADALDSALIPHFASHAPIAPPMPPSAGETPSPWPLIDTPIRLHLPAADGHAAVVGTRRRRGRRVAVAPLASAVAATVTSDAWEGDGLPADRRMLTTLRALIERREPVPA